MSNKKTRELSEMKNLFSDPKYSRQAWRAIGNSIANRPAARLPIVYDKTGALSVDSSVEQYAYDNLVRDIATLGKERSGPPTELEMIMQCQLVRARFDTSAATFVRDTLGAKPIDESKVDMSVQNPYEHLSDDELALLQQYRDARVVTTDEEDTDDVT